MEKKTRIHKVMAAAGVGSLRACEKLVAEGRVTVNGRPAAIGQPVTPGRDLIAVDGEKVYVDTRRKKRYIMLNKPRAVSYTHLDVYKRQTLHLLSLA